MPVNAIPIELDGRTRHIRYDFNALCLLEETLDISVADLPKLLRGKVKFAALRALLYAGLAHEDDMLTLAGAGDMLESIRKRPAALGEVAGAIRRAFEAAFAVEDEGSQGNPKKEAGAE